MNNVTFSFKINILRVDVSSSGFISTAVSSKALHTLGVFLKIRSPPARNIGEATKAIMPSIF